MSNYTPYKHAEVICAWAQGKPIQYYCPHEEKWKYLTDPSWFETMQYRIKPEPKYVTKYKIAYCLPTNNWFVTEEYYDSADNFKCFYNTEKPHTCHKILSAVRLENTAKQFEVKE